MKTIERQIIEKLEEVNKQWIKVYDFILPFIDYKKMIQEGDKLKEWHINLLQNVSDLTTELNALKSQLKDEEQPITVTDEMIEEIKDELYPKYDNDSDHNDNMERYRKGFDSAIAWALSLKAQKAQPGELKSIPDTDCGIYMADDDN